MRESALQELGPGSRVAAIAIAALVSTGMLAASAASHAEAKRHGGKSHHAKSDHAKRSKVRIRIATRSQAALLGSGGLRVRVKSRTRAKVRLSVAARGSRKLFRKRTVRFGRHGKRSKRVRLRLTSKGRRNLGRCGAIRVRVIGKYRKKVRRHGKWRRRKAKAHSAKRLRRDRSRPGCRGIGSPATPVTPSVPEKPPHAGETLPRIDMSKADDCDFIAEPGNPLCALPYPDDYYSKADPSSPTGRRLDFGTGTLPANAAGKKIDPARWNTLDGFSQGSTIVLKVPGIDTVADVQANGLAPINHIGRYEQPGQRAVVIDADTGKRWPIWSEIDSNATDPGKAALEIHPATNFASGGHYIVALRNLTADGKPIEAPAAFRYYRDDVPSDQARINARRPHFEKLFKTLKAAGIERHSLYLAWDFTVSSDRSNYHDALVMRNKAFATLGDTTMADKVPQGTAPSVFINSVHNLTASQNPNWARIVSGTFQVPCFLKPDCGPTGVINYGPDGEPAQNGTWDAPFECAIPRRAIDGPDPEPVKPMAYGHGLFGTAEQVTGSVNPQLAQQYGYMVCGTDEIGMSEHDLPMIAGVLSDLSKFEQLPDRLDQGLINELLLERLMYLPASQGGLEGVRMAVPFDPYPFHVDGSASSPSVIDTSHVYYMGASQGGIMGGALIAISPDVLHASLLVGAMNYSVLLPRSVDYDAYSTLLNAAYKNELSRPLLFSFIQTLWDHGEPDGFAHVMTGDPPPRTPEHTVALMIALGDHQVTNFASEVEARTVGLKAQAPVLDPGRWPDYDVLWNVPRLKDHEYPYRGSSITYLDGGPLRDNPADPGGPQIGTPPPPLTNTPNTIGEDPHGAPRGADAAVEMTATMLSPDSHIDDVCGSLPCYGGGWTGLP